MGATNFHGWVVKPRTIRRTWAAGSHPVGARLHAEVAASAWLGEISVRTINEIMIVLMIVRSIADGLLRFLLG